MHFMKRSAVNNKKCTRIRKADPSKHRTNMRTHIHKTITITTSNRTTKKMRIACDRHRQYQVDSKYSIQIKMNKKRPHNIGTFQAKLRYCQLQTLHLSRFQIDMPHDRQHISAFGHLKTYSSSKFQKNGQRQKQNMRTKCERCETLE